MPNKTIPGIPGVQGRDYEVVNYGGKVYIVFRSQLPNGQWLTDAWRVDPSDYKSFGVNPKNVRHVTAGQFKKINVFGDAGEIARQGGKNERFLDTYLKQLREVYGPNVSWLNDKEYMSIFVMGWMEKWDPAVIQQALKRTKWYQSRTAAERSWELDMNKEERKVSIENMTSRVTEALQDLYGPDMQLKQAGITGKDIAEWSQKIASGQYGDPTEGFQTWLENQRTKAEKIEGSQAWIDRQGALEEQRSFLNRPEDMKQKLLEDSRYMLGPHGVPSDETLTQWSEKIVSERKSDADWQQFLEKQASRLYPWLAAGEGWQDFADPYRRMATDTWGYPIDWDDKILRQLGAVDANGQPTGMAMTFNDFELQLRKNERFWQSPTAAKEGYDLLNSLTSVFRGV